jgi:hypothetical protein
LLGVEGMADVEGGVAIEFGADRDIAPVIEHLRCHIAFAAARGTEGIEHCALYVQGARVEARGQTVLLTTSDSARVDELRRRARVQEP